MTINERIFLSFDNLQKNENQTYTHQYNECILWIYWKETYFDIY